MLLSVSAAAGMIAVRVLGYGEWRAILTLIASTGFVMVAVLGGALGSRYGALVLAALGCCWLGDMLGPLDFLWGAYAFFVAHLFLIPAFHALGISWRSVLVAVFPLGATGLLQLAYLLPHVPPEEHVTVIAYTIVISVMVLAAAGAWRQSIIIPVAAILFYVSDHFVGRWRYIGGDWNGLICYPLYYTACLQFAYSVFILARKRSSPVSPPEVLS